MAMMRSMSSPHRAGIGDGRRSLGLTIEDTLLARKAFGHARTQLFSLDEGVGGGKMKAALDGARGSLACLSFARTVRGVDTGPRTTPLCGGQSL